MFKFLGYLNKVYRFKKIIVWYLKSDIVDLYRNFIVRIEDSGNNELEIIFENEYLKFIDSL